MNISSLMQNSSLFNHSALTGSTKTQDTTSAQNLAEILKKLREKEDRVSFSKEALALSNMPPEKPDFANMSDEDLTRFLTQMQERTGSIPGIDDSEETDISTLSAEQLQKVRDTLIEMTQKRMEEMKQSRNTQQAISAYAANSGVAL